MQATQHAKAQKITVKHLIRLRKHGRQAECAKEICRLLALTSVDSKTRRLLLYLRADCYLDIKKWKQAIMAYSEILAEKQEFVASANRGLALWESGRRDEAFKDFRQAICNEPANAIVLRLIGRLQVERHKVQSALWYLRRAIKVAPHDAIGYVYFGDAAAKSENWVLAYRAYLAASKLDPSNKRALQQVEKIERFFELNRKT